jgi:uncharacterized pyridoxal phosphate-containing UPF0001 family protein
VDHDTIRQNLERVRSRLVAALGRARRGPGSCRLLAVTKLRPPGAIEALAAAGQYDFGENRVQEAAQKIPEVKAEARWHLVGHLQRNKVRKALDLFEVVHSVDSLRLLDALGGRAAEAGLPAAPSDSAAPACACCRTHADRQAGKRLDIFLEVNVSGEERKFGFRPDEVDEACRRAADLPALRLVGLMTMASFVDDAETVRPVFRGLRELRDRLNDAAAYREPLAGLSMGMTQDFEVAAEEGATWVRVGTALFDGAE